jgi:hypothetical protein
LIDAHYNKDVVALAIITEKRPKKEIGYFSYNLYGTKLLYEYNSLELSELDDKELLSSDNPVDLMLCAAKFAMNKRSKRANNDELRKFNFLREAVELLNKRGWDAEDKRDLLLFIECIVNMKNAVFIAQYNEISGQKTWEGKDMNVMRELNYIPLMMRDSAAEIERRGMEKGMEKGRLEGKLEIARKMLTRGTPLDAIAETTELPMDRIQALIN